MSAVVSEIIPFKFHWLDDDGNESGFLRKQGRFDGETLVLDDVEIPIVVMLQVAARDNRMAVTALSENGEPATMAFSVTKVSAAELKSAIDVSLSSGMAAYHKEELQKKGREHAYRDMLCPECGATVILSDMPETPQLFCHFCDSLSTIDPHEEVPAGERDLKVCEECGMFSKPRKFTVVYIYFLLVVYGWRYYSKWSCPACMRKDAWKMFFGNLIFVIGVPVAIVQLIRSYGGSIGSGPFKELDSANLKARKGNVLGALEGYRSILQRVPYSAGIKYNLGISLLQQDDKQRAAESFRVALEDCSNYVPAYQLLAHCYEQLGETEKLEELKEMWDETPSEDENIFEQEEEEIDDLEGFEE